MQRHDALRDACQTPSMLVSMVRTIRFALACLSDRRFASVCCTLCCLFSNGSHACATHIALLTSGAATVPLQATSSTSNSSWVSTRKNECKTLLFKLLFNTASHALCMHSVVLLCGSSWTGADTGIVPGGRHLQHPSLCLGLRLTRTQAAGWRQAKQQTCCSPALCCALLPGGGGACKGCPLAGGGGGGGGGLPRMLPLPT